MVGCPHGFQTGTGPLLQFPWCSFIALKFPQITEKGRKIGSATGYALHVPRVHQGGVDMRISGLICPTSGRDILELRRPGISSCQTKMLVGEDCSVPLNITEAIFEEAHRRLLNMPFVGKFFYFFIGSSSHATRRCLLHWPQEGGKKPELYSLTRASLN